MSNPSLNSTALTQTVDRVTFGSIPHAVSYVEKTLREKATILESSCLRRKNNVTAENSRKEKNPRNDEDAE